MGKKEKASMSDRARELLKQKKDRKAVIEQMVKEGYGDGEKQPGVTVRKIARDEFKMFKKNDKKTTVAKAAPAKKVEKKAEKKAAAPVKKAEKKTEKPASKVKKEEKEQDLPLEDDDEEVIDDSGDDDEEEDASEEKDDDENF